MHHMDESQFNETFHANLAGNKSLQAEHDALIVEHELLKAKHTALLESSEKIIVDRDSLKQRVEELQAINRHLTAQLYGRRSERRPGASLQPLLFNADDALTEEEKAVIVALEKVLELSDEEIVKNYRNRKKQRSPVVRSESFPEHFERRDEIIDLGDAEKEGLVRIGDSITERLVMQVQALYVRRLIQRQYVVPGKPDCGIQSEPLPLNFVPGSKFDFSVVATLLAQKFGWHIPTHRSQDIFAGMGWAPSRSTINDLFNQSDEILAPLFNQMNSLILQDSIVLSDDTTLRLLTRNSLSDEQQLELELRKRRKGDDSEAGIQAKQGSVLSYAWVYNGLDDGAPYNAFQWTIGRRQKTVAEHLDSFSGTLVGDAFGGNVRLPGLGAGIQFAACNVHARREFVKAEDSAAVESSQAIAFYKMLYAIEDRAKSLSPEGRQQMRMKEAKPIWDRFRQWLDGIPPSKKLPKSLLGKAVTYMTNHWEALTLYLLNGRIPIDNSQSERAIRPLVIGRKNWLFLGHPQAAESRLRLFSIVSSANRHHLILDRYLEDVLRELAWARQHAPAELELGSERLLRCLPDRWAESHPDCARQFRREERTDRSERERYNKARRRIEQRQAKQPAPAQ